jgi:hypothetical protein
MDENSADKVCLSDVTGTSQRISDGHGSSHRISWPVCARGGVRGSSLCFGTKGGRLPLVTLAASSPWRRRLSRDARARPRLAPTRRIHRGHRRGHASRAASRASGVLPELRAVQRASHAATRNDLDGTARGLSRQCLRAASRRSIAPTAPNRSGSIRWPSCRPIRPRKATCIAHWLRGHASEITRASSERPKLRSEESASASPNPPLHQSGVSANGSNWRQQRVPHNVTSLLAIGPLSPPVPEQRKRSEDVLRKESQTRGYPSGLPSRHAHSRTHDGANRATEKGGERKSRVGTGTYDKSQTIPSGGVPPVTPETLVSQISRSVCMIQSEEGDTLALCLLFGIVALWPLSLSNRRGHDSKLDSLD